VMLALCGGIKRTQDADINRTSGYWLGQTSVPIWLSQFAR
jgi:putative component of toxin-antitoxin plasmid stabilization module